MTVRNAFAAAAVAVLLCAPTVRADEPTPGALAAAKELTELALSGGLQTVMLEPGWVPLESAIRRAKPAVTDAQLAGVKAAFQKIVLEEVAPAMTRVPALYAKHFSEDELRAILAFYRTPAGAKALSVLPQLTNESMQLVMKDFSNSMPRMQARIGKALAENGLGDLR